MGGASLLLDLPADLTAEIWAPILLTDPQAVLRMETASKQLKQRLLLVNLLARFMILNKQQAANSQACSAVLMEAHRRLARTGSLSRPEYLTLCRAVGACKVAAKHVMRVRQRVLKRDGHVLPALHQSSFKEISVKSEETYSSGYQTYQRLLLGIRALVTS